MIVETPEAIDSEIREIASVFPEGAFRDCFLEYRNTQCERFASLLNRLARKQGAKPRRVLDAGSFPGSLSLLLKRRGYEVAALAQEMDVAAFPPAADFLKTIERNGIPLYFCDLERQYAPLPEGGFDLVILTEVIEHMAFHPFHAMAECCRLLATGGSLWVSTPNLANAVYALRLLRGRSIFKPLDGPWAQAFPSMQGIKHEREYTRDELRFFFEPGERYMHHFEEVQTGVHAWFDDPLGGTGPRTRRLASILARLFPKLGNALFASGRKPDGLRMMTPDALQLEGEWSESLDPVSEGRTFLPATYPYPFRYLRGEGILSFQLPEDWPPNQSEATLLLPWVWHRTQPPLPSQWVLFEELGQGQAQAGGRVLVPANADMRMVRIPLGRRSARGPRQLRLRLRPEAPIVPDEILSNGDTIPTGPALAQAHWGLECASGAS